MGDVVDQPDANASEESTTEPPAAAASSESGRRRTRTTARVAVRSIIVLASVAALAITAASWTALDRFKRGLNTADVIEEGKPFPDDTANDILLVGSDSRTDAQGDPLPRSVLKILRTEATNGLNTDTIILVRVPDDGSKPTAVSIPRDTSVHVPGNEPAKINGIYGLTKAATEDRLLAGGMTTERAEDKARLAGRRALIRAVQSLTGVQVDHYAEVNLLGFYEVTKALGGVRVCLKNATSDKDSGADFAAGVQTISGADALAFVRQRRGLPDGDLDRIVRQQAFMAAVADKVLSTGTLTDAAKINKLIEAARKSVVLDDTWELTDFVRRMQSLATGGVRFVTLPIADATARNARGQSVVKVRPERVEKFIEGLAHGPPKRTGSSEPSTPPSGESSEPPTDRLTASGRVKLDGGHGGSPRQLQDPITIDGVPCVN